MEGLVSAIFFWCVNPLYMAEGNMFWSYTKKEIHNSRRNGTRQRSRYSDAHSEMKEQKSEHLLFSNAIPFSDEVNREQISRRRYEKVGRLMLMLTPTVKNVPRLILTPGILRRKLHYVNQAKRTLHGAPLEVIAFKLLLSAAIGSTTTTSCKKNCPPNITGNQSQSWARSQKIDLDQRSRSNIWYRSQIKITQEHLPCSCAGCPTGNGEKLNSTQAKPTHANNSGVAYFASISCGASCARAG